MSETAFVTIRQNGEPATPASTINSLEKAIESLDELGLCMNWANLSNGSRTTVLLYEGWTYRHSHERFVALPFDPDTIDFAERFADLLRQIFLPFFPNLDPAYDGVHRSLITVAPHLNEKGCFLVSLILVMHDKLVGSGYRRIVETLEKVSDGTEPNHGMIFYLD